MKDCMCKVFVVIVCLLLPPMALAEIYKTYDENGRVVFTQIPPSKDAEEYQTLKDNPVEATPAGNTSRLKEQNKYLEYLEEERLERKEKFDQKKTEKAELQAKCNSVKAQLEDLSGAGSRYYELDEDGNRVVVGYEKIEQQKNYFQQYINQNCNGL